MTRTQQRSVCLAFAAFAALASKPLSAHPAWGIIVDPSGQVYFSDLETVWRIDSLGRLSVARSGASGRHVHELAVDDQGNVYGPDYEYVSEAAGFRTALWRLDSSGRVTYTVPPGRALPRGASIWRDRAGNTYSVEEDNHLKRETLLVKRSARGEVTLLAGGRYGFADGTGSHAQFSNIAAMTIGQQALFVTDGSAVRKVSFTGVVSTLARNLDTDKNAQRPLSFGGLMGLAVGPAGNVYVADFRNRRVLKVTARGMVSVLQRCDPPWSPTGVALAPNGDLHILEFGFEPPGTWLKPRVRKLSSRGATTTEAIVK